MSLNCNEIDLILSELNITGYFIQDIIQPGFDTLALYLYANGNAKTLLICTAQNSCRLHETRRKITKNEKPLRFMELLKSRIKGAKITEISQIQKSRIIRISLTHAEEDFFLYIRLWSNAANIILCTVQNQIIDSMFRRPKKGETTGGIFVPPDAEQNSEPHTHVDAKTNEKPNAKSLNSSIKQEQKEWPIRTFSELQEEYAKTHPDYPNLSFNQKVDLWYGEHAENLSRTALLEQAEKWYLQRRTKLDSALQKLKQKQNDFSHAENLRHTGDLILSNAHLIKAGQKFLSCQDYQTGKTVEILIDPKKSAHENAAVYYENYKKAVSGTESLNHDISLTQKKILKLEKLYQEIQNEKNPVRIEQLLRKDSAPKQQQKKQHPGLDYTVDGWYILVGRDANENDELLRHHVRGSDMWLHVRDFPGGYVFIKNRPGKTIPLEILLDAANLAVYYSKARNAGKTDLYYTHVKYLRRAKNGPKGLVLPTHEKNLCITPDKKRIEKLEMLKDSLI